MLPLRHTACEASWRALTKSSNRLFKLLDEQMLGWFFPQSHCEDILHLLNRKRYFFSHRFAFLFTNTALSWAWHQFMISPLECSSSSQPAADRSMLPALALEGARTWGRIYPKSWLTPLGISVLSWLVQPLQIRTGCNPAGTEQWEERSSPLLLSLNSAENLQEPH